MPRRKTLPPLPDYKDGGRSPSKLLVQKTNPLLTLSETDITLPALKILDAYLSRIDSHRPDKRHVRFEKGAIEDLLGVTQIKPKDLEKRIANLFQVVRVVDESKPNGFKLVALFDKAECYQDEDGLWQVDLAAGESAMEYIFNPENLGYLRYRLANVINLTSRYSYILYLYLENNRFRGTWEVDLDELKELLRCTADTYKQYYRFNELVLKKCHQEINEKTTLHFDYEPVKRGRTVSGVKIILETQSQAEISGQMMLSDISEPDLELDADVDAWSNAENVAFLRDACCNEFSADEILLLVQDIVSHSDKFPFLQEKGSIVRNLYDYLSLKYRKMNAAEGRKTIKHRFAYILAMIEKDYS